MFPPDADRHQVMLDIRRIPRDDDESGPYPQTFVGVWHRKGKKLPSGLVAVSVRTAFDPPQPGDSWDWTVGPETAAKMALHLVGLLGLNA